jgi:hypothetical protein
LIIQLLNSGNRLFWGALKLSWYFAATCPQSSSGKFSENKCCLRVEDLCDKRFSPRHFCLTYCYLGVCKRDFAEIKGMLVEVYFSSDCYSII